jgi:predicted choloylglycine hydrolase
MEVTHLHAVCAVADAWLLGPLADEVGPALPADRTAPYAARVGPLRLTFYAVDEAEPGARWQARFHAGWPAYRAWYLRDGEAPRPSADHAARMLRRHMPELAPVWERLVGLAGGDELAARMLTLYDSPPLVSGCSQAVLGRSEPLLVRNYDFHPSSFEGVICRTAMTGQRVIGMSDCLWGLLDGVNDAGLAVSLTFGGRRAAGPGFAAPLVVRYLLEVCATTQDAMAALARIPIQASYNFTMADRRGAAATVRAAPDRPAEIGPAPVAANHQGRVEWPEHATALASVEREARLHELLGDESAGDEPLVDAFLTAPLRSTAYDSGFGTLYTAVHRPARGSVEYRWPGSAWRQSFDAFEEGQRVVQLV